MKKLLFGSLIMLLFATGCGQVFGKRVHGSGHITTQSRNIESFNGIDVSGAIDVFVTQNASTSARVEGDDNLLEYVVMEVRGNILQVHSREGYNLHPSKHLRVYVTSPEYKSFEASGACDIQSENQIKSNSEISIGLSGASDIKMDLDAPSVDADMSGAGTVELKGKTQNLSISGSGSSDIKCKDLMAENVRVDISGAGDAEVFASMKLDVEVSGAGTVKYKGTPSVSKNISGAGSVKKID
jgi:Protein of unknown function (DUF2807).